jgi:hypothetical protein
MRMEGLGIAAIAAYAAAGVTACGSPSCAIRVISPTGAVVIVYQASCSDVQRLDPTRFGSSGNTVVSGAPPGSPVCSGQASGMQFAFYGDGGNDVAQACAALEQQGLAH